MYGISKRFNLRDPWNDKVFATLKRKDRVEIISSADNETKVKNEKGWVSSRHLVERNSGRKNGRSIRKNIFCGSLSATRRFRSEPWECLV